MTKRKFAVEDETREPSATIVVTPAGMRRYEHRKVAATVRVTVLTPTAHSSLPDIQEILASEKALLESYNSLDKHLRLHRPCHDEGLAPNHGSHLHALWAKGQLSKQQLYGWQMFYDDLKRAKGASNSVVSSMGGGSTVDYANRQLQRSKPGHTSGWNKQAARLDEILGGLHDHERGLLVQLVRDALRTEGFKEIHAHTLPYLGSVLSGYRDNRQSISAAVSRIQALLTSIAERYNVLPFEEDVKAGQFISETARQEKSLNLRKKRLASDEMA
jgi:hypothetical protein